MSSFNRRTVLLSLAALAGCGFEPVYGPGSVSERLRGRIVVDPPVDDEGYALVRRLEDRLGQPTTADLRLTANIGISEQAVGFLPEGSISRYNVLGRVTWSVTRQRDGKRAGSGSEQAFTSYSATSTTVATIFARRDARERLMIILADRVVASIMAGDFRE